eukprot:TRINITY_DN98875_c0_g1_i1.p1 TRINITY_DN98875_c0_g1~~TRINITY_DN98875_c0_g1_i1.p1  ORF type:complete len:165 (-),score=45.66 TRINITY_DN98875_c0_g1_i1:16-510(-)
MLRPDYPKAGVDKLDFFKQKFGSEARALQVFENVLHSAREEGLDYAPLAGLKTGSSVDAHRLLIWARGLGKEQEAIAELYKAYNIEGKWLGDHEVLACAAERAGLDSKEALAFLGDESKGQEELQQSLQRASQLGVSGVPFFVVNGRLGISGAQPEEAFLRVFA